MIAALIISLALATAPERPAFITPDAPSTTAPATASQTASGLTTITLRRAVRFTEAPTPLRLADCAEIEGPLAETLAEIELAPSLDSLPTRPGGWRTLEAAAVRAALETNESLNLGRVALHGAQTHLHAGLAPRRDSAADDEAATPSAPLGGTVEAHLLARLRSVLAVGRDDMRVWFDPRDRELLKTPVAGRTVEIRPAGLSERMPLAVTVYERDRVVASGTVTARVRVKREVLVTSASVTRGEAISGTNTTAQTLWLPPDARPVPPAEALGAVARSVLVPGRPVEIDDLESPNAAKRGDRIMVHAVGRGVVVRMPGRVKADARVGETVQVELIGSREVVTARMDGPGRAVLVVEAASPEAVDPAGPPRAHDGVSRAHEPSMRAHGGAGRAHGSDGRAHNESKGNSR